MSNDEFAGARGAIVPGRQKCQTKKTREAIVHHLPPRFMGHAEYVCVGGNAPEGKNQPVRIGRIDRLWELVEQDALLLLLEETTGVSPTP